MPFDTLRKPASQRKKPPKTISPASFGSRRAGRVSASATRPTSANASSQAPWSPRPRRNRRSGPGAVPNATGLLVIVAATFGATWGEGSGRRTVAALAPGEAAGACGARRHFAVGDRSRTAFLPADASEAVVAERQPELGVVGRAADERAVGGWG